MPILFSLPIYISGTALFKQPKIYWIIISILFALVWIITYPRLFRNIIKKHVKKLLQEGDNSSLFGQMTMIVDENEIKVISEISTEITLKKSIKDIKIYDDMILIYISSILAHIVPTRYLNEETKEKLLKGLKVA